jgi:hypothetical protein
MPLGARPGEELKGRRVRTNFVLEDERFIAAHHYHGKNSFSRYFGSGVAAGFAFLLREKLGLLFECGSALVVYAGPGAKYNASR